MAKGDMTDWTIHHGDCIATLRTMPAETVQTCVTSPPYFGLRDYGTARWEGGDDPSCDHKGRVKQEKFNERYYGHPFASDKIGEVFVPMRATCTKCGAQRIDAQIGLEESPEEYVQKIVEVFREVRRVLRPDGTVWLNLGDSYSHGGCGERDAGRWPKQSRNDHMPRHAKKSTGLKPKDLIGIPWLVAFALRADGWYLRADIIWHKTAPMPESITDRPTKAHEYIFLLSKSEKYYYDHEAIKEPAVTGDHKRNGNPAYPGYQAPGQGMQNGLRERRQKGADASYSTRNKRDVWTVGPSRFLEAHFATFSPELIEPRILAGAAAQACELCGAPWERILQRAKASKSRRVGKSAAKRGMGLATAFSGYEDGSIAPTMVTKGWKPTCKCKKAKGLGASIVLDPFNGAGTTGLVSVMRGRRYVGIELNAEYVAMSKRRITNATVQQTIFAAVGWEHF